MAKFRAMIRAGTMPQGNNNKKSGRGHTNPKEGPGQPTLILRRGWADPR